MTANQFKQKEMKDKNNIQNELNANNMQVQCEDCGKIFDLTAEQEKDFWQYFVAKGINNMVARCSFCHNMVMLHPLTIAGLSDEISQMQDNRLFYCPTSCCVGFVEYDSESRDYNCGDCGCVWKNKDEVYQSIAEIVKRYAHRKEVYKKTKNGWKPVKTGNASDNYYSKVQNNEEDK